MSIIGIGTDIVEIARMQASINRSNSMAKRILTSNEYQDYSNLLEVNTSQNSEFENKISLNISSQARFLAKRFAAKEATVKAIGNGIGNGVSWQQIEVSHFETGQPYVKVSGHLEVLFQLKGVNYSHLSISDEKHYAVATVILET